MNPYALAVRVQVEPALDQCARDRTRVDRVILEGRHQIRTILLVQLLGDAMDDAPIVDDRRLGAYVFK